MVKRQTVWLSTMMVLSLMLIGYYTLGTPPANPASGGSGNSGSTVVQGQGPTQTKGAASGSVPASSRPASGAAGSSSPSDWFVQYSMDQSNHQSKVIQTLETTLSDPRASQSVVSNAYQELTTIQTQQADASRIHDLLLGQGYPDSIVVYNPHNQVQVWVEARSLSPLQAVKVINLVAQTLGIPSNEVTVSAHA